MATTVQIFGVKNSQATRAAERFFKERRVAVQYVDLKVRPMAAGEIQRFVQKFTLEGILDKASKPYVDAGLQHMILGPEAWMRKIETSPLLLKLPMVRCGKHLAVGLDEASWKLMLEA